ncbi:MAG: PIN domain-containing protein [Burkholderiaceae bacterium]
MLGIVTNVLVRFLIRDEKEQFNKARKLIKRELSNGKSVFINQLVLLETEWVLRSLYGLTKIQLLQTISGLLDAIEVQLEDESDVEEALFIWRDAKADFADCLIGARNRRLG